MNKTEEILQLKKLLDSGLINQSDFDRLKKLIFEEHTSSDINSDIFKSDIEEKNEIIEKKCQQCGFLNQSENTNCQSCFAFFENNAIQDIQTQENNAEIRSNDKTKYFFIATLVVFCIIIFTYSFSISNSNENESAQEDSVVIDSTSNDTSYVEAESAIPSDTAVSFKNDTTSYGDKSYSEDNFDVESNYFIGKWVDENSIITFVNDDKYFPYGKCSFEIQSKGYIKDYFWKYENNILYIGSDIDDLLPHFIYDKNDYSFSYKAEGENIIYHAERYQ
jgi:hypothetical protein